MVYQIIDNILKQHADMSAAEAHGVATGILCVDVQSAPDRWLNELFANTTPDDEDSAQLTRLFEQTRVLLIDDNYRFDLLLPDEQEALNVQTEALRDWCMGFLFGIGYAGTESHWPGDVGEILKDMVELTKVDTSAEDDDEEATEALTEINEYLRSAIFLIQAEFNNTQATQH